MWEAADKGKKSRKLKTKEKNAGSIRQWKKGRKLDKGGKRLVCLFVVLV